MKCPYCAETIKREAIKCKHCGEWLPKERLNSKLEDSNLNVQPKQDYIRFPIELNSISINENHFKYDKEIHSYDEVIGLLFKKANTSINFGKISTIDLHIKTSENIFGARCVISKKDDPTDEFDEAIRYLDKITFNNRAHFYLNQLTKNGCFTYEYRTELGLKSSIKIFSDGYIQKGNKKINLKKARKNGILKFGAEWYWGANYSINPHEVVISEKKVKYAMQLRTLRIFTDWDSAIIQSIIGQLAEEKSF